MNQEINSALGGISIFICLILIQHQLFFAKRDKSSRWYLLIILSDLGMLLGDFVDSFFGRKAGDWVHVLMIMFPIILYFICSGLLLFSMVGWVKSMLSAKERLSKWWMKLCGTLAFMQALVAVTMPFTKICYIDAQNRYRRSSYFFLGSVFPYIIYLILFGVIIRHIKAFRKSERVYLVGFIILPMVANIIQIIDGRYLISSPAIALGLVVITLFIMNNREREREEELNQMEVTKNRNLEEMRRRQEKLSYQLIDVLCGAVEAKDFYTRGHSLRVAQYAREIMYRLGGDEQAQDEIYCIGILHDIGKISVNDEIINKNSRLTDEEYDKIRLHTVAGYQILREVDIIPDLAVGARWHHERYDGTGYPNGLAGENIPLVARIISVADAYDAMTSNRSYHSTVPQSEVREQIARGMGTQFDPKIAQIMLDMIDEDIAYEMKQVIRDDIIQILMIDDDSFVHNMVEQLLEDENYVFTFASSGEEGIELLKENKYDLVLLDKEMPGMNGVEVLQWIHDNMRKMKVIFLTGDKELQTIRDSESLGAVDYITKPINVRILRESIKGVLAH